MTAVFLIEEAGNTEGSFGLVFLSFPSELWKRIIRAQVVQKQIHPISPYMTGSMKKVAGRYSFQEE